MIYGTSSLLPWSPWMVHTDIFHPNHTLHWRFRNTLHENNYSSENMLSMMTLSVEHFHSTTHMKHTMLSPLQYAMSFMTAIKESHGLRIILRAPKGAGIHHPKSLPTTLRFPNRYHLKYIQNRVEEEEMRQWAQTYTKGVRPQSVRQETTMDKSGTLPHYHVSSNMRLGAYLIFQALRGRLFFYFRNLYSNQFGICFDLTVSRC